MALELVNKSFTAVFPPLVPPSTPTLQGLTHLNGLQYTICVLLITTVPPLIGVLSPSLETRRAIIFLLLAEGVWLVRSTTTGELRKDDMLGNAVGATLLWCTDILLLSNAQRDFWKVGEPKFHDLPRRKRFAWAFDLVHNYFGIGWNWEETKAHPPHPSDEGGKWPFVAYELARLLWANLMVDLTMTLWRKRPAMHVGGSMLQDGPGWLAVYVVAWHVDLAFRMIRGHAAIHCFLVLFNLEKPSNAPNQFGGIRYAYSVRKFWGKCWHDQFRRFLTTNSKYVTRELLGLQKPSRLRRYLELHLVFLLSGLIHWLGTYMMLRSLRGPNLTVLYFVLQASVIMLEDQLVSLGKRMGVKDGWSVRLVGYAWTLGWTMALLPLRADPIVKAGFFDHGNAKEWSFVQGVWEGKWWAEFERTMR